MVVPIFGLLANLLCMVFYLVGPKFFVPGMSWHESYIALGVAAVWGIYGAIYFLDAKQEDGQVDDSHRPAHRGERLRPRSVKPIPSGRETGANQNRGRPSQSGGRPHVS